MHSTPAKGTVVAVLGAALLCAGTAAPAAAAKHEATVSSEPLVTPAANRAGERAFGEQSSSEQALDAYWTPERMRAARPAEEMPGLASDLAAAERDAAHSAGTARAARSRGATARVTRTPGRVAPAKARSSSPARSVKAPFAARAAAVQPNYPYNSFQARTAGKVFFTNTTNGLNYVCSATIVNTSGKNSVWTAGHCVHGGQGRNWHANWTFVPSYVNGWEPYGRWIANRLSARTSWTGQTDYDSDIGVATMAPRSGWRIADYLGGQGLTWNRSKRIAVTAFGYPSGAPFNGQTLQTCTGTTFPKWEVLFLSAESLGLVCDMTPGSSGGGWLAYFDGNRGYLNGNNSHKTGNPNVMYSPYYDDTAASLYSDTGGL